MRQRRRGISSYSSGKNAHLQLHGKIPRQIGLFKPNVLIWQQNGKANEGGSLARYRSHASCSSDYRGRNRLWSLGGASVQGPGLRRRIPKSARGFGGHL